MASKVSSDVHGVDTMVGHLAEGRFKIGAGDTAVMLEGIITPGKPLPGMVPIVTDNHLLLHDNRSTATTARASGRRRTTTT